MKKILKSIHPDDAAHYQSMGLEKGVVHPWEDGLRTTGVKGDYEWWYYDSHFPDGTILVIIFYTKLPVEVNRPITPLCTLELTLPDGTKISDQVTATLEESSYEKKFCDVHIGESYITGDLKHYDIVFKGRKAQAKVSLDGTIPAWRSQSGSIFFGDREEHYFAWLPAIPEGRAVADVTVDGKSLHLEGSGYHDHNWGNVIMLKPMHHWYWGRAKIGDYKVISAWITAEKKYGYKDFDVFMLARGDKILGDNSNHTLKFIPEDEYIDDYTGKPVWNKVRYEYTTGEGEVYRITYARHGDVSRNCFINLLSGVKKAAAKLIGFDGGYLRFEGTATIEKIEDGKVVESVSEPAVWELMYFGHAMPQTIK